MSDKRKRSPSPTPVETGEGILSPPEPMVPGVAFQDFLTRGIRIVRKHKDNKEKRNTELSVVLEDAGEYVFENSGGIDDAPFKMGVQLVHTLLEFGATYTTAVALEGEEAEKIARLNRHLSEGLDLIGGKWSPAPVENGEGIPSPPEPMAPGVAYQGFLTQAIRIARKHKDNKAKRNAELRFVLEGAGEHVLESSGGIHDAPFEMGVQLVHTLLEFGAAYTTAVALEGEEAEKISKLNKHLLEGLALIGGKSVEDDCTSDEGEK